MVALFFGKYSSNEIEKQCRSLTHLAVAVDESSLSQRLALSNLNEDNLRLASVLCCFEVNAPQNRPLSNAFIFDAHNLVLLALPFIDLS